MVGQNGYSVGSSSFGLGSNAVRGSLLNTNKENVNTMNNPWRADAFPVRCVQEIAGLQVVTAKSFEKTGCKSMIPEYRRTY